MSSPDPGWYDDPYRRTGLRWWDGASWTEHTAEWPTGPRPSLRHGDVSLELDKERQIAPWLQRLLFVWPIALALSLGGFVTSIDSLLSGDDSSPPSSWWVGQLGGLVGIAVSVLRIVWLYRSATVSRDLGRPARREPMHAAIGWLIPIINYWWPYQGVTDLFAPSERPAQRIAWWWALSILSQTSVLLGLLVPFVPVGLAVLLVAIVIGMAVASAALEIGLVRDALADHEKSSGATRS